MNTIFKLSKTRLSNTLKNKFINGYLFCTNIFNIAKYNNITNYNNQIKLDEIILNKNKKLNEDNTLILFKSINDKKILNNQNISCSKETKESDNNIVNTSSSNDIIKEISNNDNNSNKKNFNNIFVKLKIFKKKEQLNELYSDKLIYFKYQWNKIQKEKNKFNQNYISPDFNNHQKLEVDAMYNIINEFNNEDQKLFMHYCDYFKNSGYEINAKNVGMPVSPLNNPNFIDTQEILYCLKPFLATNYFFGGSNKAAIEATQAAAQAVIDKELKTKQEQIENNKPKVKAVVNLKYLSFDSTKKIALIKEFRSIYNYGLKEAKEAVEKVPSIIEQNIKKEKALDLKKKLEAAGAVLELE